MSPKSADSKRRPAPAGPVLAGQHRLGLALALVTAVGWGLNWPTMKFLLSEWPPLFARGLSGLVAATALATIAAVRGERLAVPQRLWPRLAAASFTNVFAWMGFTTVAMRWLDAGESALLVYTMPIWALMFAWPFQGRRPDGASLLALALGMGGVAILFAPGAAGPVAAFSGERGLG
ncbi:MAG: DMT family transporter, partial [Burkholderiaceae bacterium]